MKLLKKILKEADSLTGNVLNKHFQANFPNHEFDQHDAATLGLLEDMVGKTNSLIVLVESDNLNGTDALTRMIFENYVFIKFILEKDTKTRGESYVNSIRYNNMKLFDLYTSSKESGEKVRQFLSVEKEKFIQKFPDLSDQQYRQKLKDDFLRPLNLNSEKKLTWYNFNGKTNNFRKLCEHIGKEAEYLLLYKLYSSEVHATQALSYFKFKENYIEVFRKKSFDQKHHIDTVSNFLMDIIREIYGYYKLKSDLGRFNTNVYVNHKTVRELL
ncbi:DUF5677 domain-containing protein [Cytobacillus praedii]|uniref:DUF5677 domain-containing protein n=1 Tax=Cytobacillus praedii TaxID=1742358 RepID=UPI002E1F84F0|nr:DUF5677 domain-containing protein [Cytobacillus praedii]